MRIRLPLATAVAFALAACGSQEPAAEAPADDTAMAPEPAAAPDPATPQGFVDLAASSDMYEIEAGRLAEQMGQSQEIKDFGAMMVEDHTTSSNNLKTAASEAGNGLTVPTTMLPQHQQQLDALRNAGADFDRLYTEQQVAAHQEALSLLQTQAETGTVEPLKSFAAETAPVVQGHLEHARELAVAAQGSATGGGA